MDRRGFLAGSAALASAPAWADLGRPALLAAARLRDGTYALHGLTGMGQIAFRVPLPARGHAAAAHPYRPIVVAFARRPGTFAMVLDCVAGLVTHQLTAPNGRHFYGHGAFFDNGRLLATTENDIATGAGRIGIWDATDGFRRFDEIASGGTGPHEIVGMPDESGLVVANGGIRTHPATGREKLNLDTMRPNLTYLRDDKVVEVVEPPHRHLSFRHLAVRSDGTVAAAIQWQGDPAMPVPLLALHRRGKAIEMRGDDISARMQGYAGSVAWSGNGEAVAITGPRGGLATIWRGDDHDLLHRSDICGVAPVGPGLAFTDGLGGMLVGDVATRHPVAWDNHLVTVTPVA